MLLMPVFEGPSGQSCTCVVLEPAALAIANANRPKPADMYDPGLYRAFQSLLYPYHDFEDELSADELRSEPTSPDDMPHAISPEDAAAEVDFIFRVFKYGYAGYQYFGGDDAFGAAKARILEELSCRSEDILQNEYESIICSHLGFIQDGHLSLGRTRLCKYYVLFWNPEREFHLDEHGFYATQDGAACRVLSIEGAAPSKHLKPSINCDGDIVYIPGVIRPELSEGISISIEYEDGHAERMQLEPMKSGRLAGPAYELGQMGEVPLVASRSFGPTAANLDYLNAFVEDAGRLRDEPVIVLDLRSNPGGDSTYPARWVWRLLLQTAKAQQVSAKLTTVTAVALYANTLRHYLSSSQTLADAAALLGRDDSSPHPGWSRIYHEAGTTVSNDPFIAVITDSFIASAAEGLVLSLRHMDNVVFIGANTRGALLTGNVALCYLPFSKLGMSVPVMLTPYEDLDNRDGLGLLPDFWVDPDKALDRVEAFLEKHLVMEAGEARESNPLEGLLNP